jgi:hypothetical protein
MGSASYRPRLQHRLKQNATFSHGNGEHLNKETSADVVIRRLSRNPSVFGLTYVWFDE